MDPMPQKRQRGRPKKRRADVKSNTKIKRQEVHRQYTSLVGQYVLKEFEGHGIYLGKVTHYDTGLYRVEYEDKDYEELESSELRQIVLPEDELDSDSSARKKKLNDLIVRNSAKRKKKLETETVEAQEDVDCISIPSSMLNAASGGSMIGKDGVHSSATMESTSPPQLPPSSGTIEVPEEYVSHLLSVYSFLRSFNLRLFLAPFRLSNFVASLNCHVQNTLLDAIHLSLLRSLGSHLEKLSSEGSESATKGLRYADWGLLDALTWPIYLIRYLTLMGYTKGPQWKGFHYHVLHKEYYSLDVGMKLAILLILCDDVVESAELRAEIDIREKAEVGVNGDKEETDFLDKEMRIISEDDVAFADDVDKNGDECRLCGMDGILLCCDGCPSTYHSRCIGVVQSSLPDGPWYCLECKIKETEPSITVGTSLRGAENFGFDIYGKVFMGTCNHLLILTASTGTEQCLRYYNQTDIPRVVQTLLASAQNVFSYSDICKAILKYWDISEKIFPQLRVIEKSTDLNAEDGKLVASFPSLSNESSKNQAEQTCKAGGILRLLSETHGYVNPYAHGDFTASAAANLSVSLEESKPLEVSKMDSARKIASFNISLQVKAFSAAASRFFWPTFDKKLMDIPRERCGWCYACKPESNSRRGCLLSSAAFAATKGAMKFFNGLCPMKNREGRLESIASYILYIEETLRGLIIGPFLSTSYRKQWRRRLAEASSCSALKIPLVELEENIAPIAFSGDWVKHIDGFMAESSVKQIVFSTVGTTQKRRHFGNRHRKQSVVSEAMMVHSQDKMNIFWVGGKLLKSVPQKALLPSSMVKKAARQGSSRKISGILYTEASDIPKISRRLVWRAAVEKSANASQLAFQVRCLDLHIRWDDLVRSEQTSHDGKVSDTEASAFRNAIVRDKQIADNKISYGLFFDNRKNIPSLVMKNIIEIEQGDDGNKYWLPENRVPLYLIKEYEESVKKVILEVAKNPREVQRKQLKTTGMDIFGYLALKRDKLDFCSCTACKLDVLLGNAVKCIACQGNCHEQCTQRSTVYKGEEAKLFITCNLCVIAQKESSTGSPTSPLSLQNQDHRDVGALIKSETLENYHQTPLASVRRKKEKKSSEVKQAIRVSSLFEKTVDKVPHWGVIMRKKYNDDTSIEFARENVILRGHNDLRGLKPSCHLCKKPYNSDKMYVHCETCNNWFHAEAVQLDESKLPDVVGFKCCRCRKIKTPKCPYDETPDRSRKSTKRLRRDKELTKVDDDPLLFSVARIEQIKENNFECKTVASTTGHLKLKFTRQVKSPEVIKDLSANNSTSAEEFKLADKNRVTDSNAEMPTSTTDLSKLKVRRKVKSPEVINDLSANNSTHAEEFKLADINCATDSNAELSSSITGHLKLKITRQVKSQEVIKDLSANNSTRAEEYKLAEKNRLTDSNAEISTSYHQPIITTTIMACRMCSDTKPIPELSCEICKLAMHSHCNPWDALLPLTSKWKCANCRDWR